MTTTRFWKAATFVCVTALGVQTFRSRTQVSTTAPTVETNTPSGDEPTTDDTVPSANAHTNALIDELKNARSGPAVCDVFARMKNLRSRVVLDAALSQTNSTQGAVRACATDLLAQFDAPEAREQLLVLTQDVRADVYETAIMAVAPYDAPEVAQTLETLARGRDIPHAIAAVRGLSLAHRPGVVTLAKALLPRTQASDHALLLEAIGHSGNEGALDVLIEQATHGGYDDRMSSIRAIGQMGHPRGYAFLREGFVQTTAYERPEYLLALSNDADPATLTLLLDLARTGPEELASSAINAFANRLDTPVQAEMLELLAHARPGLYAALAEYFQHHPDAQAAPALASILRLEVGAGEELDALIPAVFASDASVARVLTNEIVSQGRDRLGVMLLRQLLLEKNCDTREVYDLALGMLTLHKTHEDSSALIELISHDDSPAATSAMLALLQVSTNDMRWNVLPLLAGRRDAATMAVLTEIVLHDRSEVSLRDDILRMLAENPDEQAVALILQSFREGTPEQRALVLQDIGSPLAVLGQPLAQEALLSSDAAQRQWAAQYFATDLQKESLDQLTRLAGDSNPDVASTARAGLLQREPARAQEFIEQGLRSGDAGEKMLALNQTRALPAQSAQPLIVASLREHDEDVVRTALSALDRFSDTQSEEWVAWVMNDTSRSPELRQMAAGILGGRGGPVSERYQSTIHALQYPNDPPASPEQPSDPVDSQGG